MNIYILELGGIHVKLQPKMHENKKKIEMKTNTNHNAWLECIWTSLFFSKYTVIAQESQAVYLIEENFAFISILICGISSFKSNDTNCVFNSIWLFILFALYFRRAIVTYISSFTLASIHSINFICFLITARLSIRIFSRLPF